MWRLSFNLPGNGWKIKRDWLLLLFDQSHGWSTPTNKNSIRSHFCISKTARYVFHNSESLVLLRLENIWGGASIKNLLKITVLQILFLYYYNRFIFWRHIFGSKWRGWLYTETLSCWYFDGLIYGRGWY